MTLTYLYQKSSYLQCFYDKHRLPAFFFVKTFNPDNLANNHLEESRIFVYGEMSSYFDENVCLVKYIKVSLCSIIYEGFYFITYFLFSILFYNLLSILYFIL